MDRENIVLHLPKSGVEAVIRSFVKNRDRKAVQRALMAGKELHQDDDPTKIGIPAENVGKMVEAQCRALLISVGDETVNPYDVLLDSEYSEDLDVVEAEVQKIFDERGKIDPKASTSGQ